MTSGDLVYKDIPDIIPEYKAGSDGNIYSFLRGGPYKLKGGYSSKGTYLHVSVVNKDGRRLPKDIHSLVCSAFHGPKKSEKFVVAHLDGDCKNNNPDNLIWTTYLTNLNHRFIHETHDSGTSNSRAVLNDETLFVCRWLLNNTKLTHYQISDILGVGRGVVSKVNSGDRYSNIEVKVGSSVIKEVLDRI